MKKFYNLEANFQVLVRFDDWLPFDLNFCICLVKIGPDHLSYPPAITLLLL